MTHHSTKWFSFKINHSENNITFQHNKYKVNFEILYISLKTFKKKIVAPFYGWGSTALRLEPLRGSSLLFIIKFLEIPGTHFIEGWTAELTLEPPSGFEHGTPGMIVHDYAKTDRMYFPLLHHFKNGIKYSRMDQIKFAAQKIWRDMICLMPVLHNFYLVHSWILCPKWCISTSDKSFMLFC